MVFMVIEVKESWILYFADCTNAMLLLLLVPLISSTATSLCRRVMTDFIAHLDPTQRVHLIYYHYGITWFMNSTGFV